MNGNRKSADQFQNRLQGKAGSGRCDDSPKKKLAKKKRAVSLPGRGIHLSSREEEKREMLSSPDSVSKEGGGTESVFQSGGKLAEKGAT